MIVPLSSDRIAEILRKAEGTVAYYDLEALANEVSRLTGQLSDCWLFLDKAINELSRGIVPSRVEAASLLHKQKAPGWKE